MFIVLIGPSGVRKGTAMNPGQAILRAANIKLASTTVTREGLIRSLSQSELLIPGSDFIHHSSLTVFSKEFTVFLGYQNLQLIADLCDLYDCDDQWEYGVKTEELQDVITNVWLNMIGATTPDSLVSSIPKDVIGGGLTSRMVLVYEDQEADIIPDPWNIPDSIEIERSLVSDIQKIGLLKGEFEKSNSWYDHRYKDWYVEMRKNPPFEDAKFSGYNKRRAIHLVKLSMILNASRTDDMILTDQDFDAALLILEAAEERMHRVYSGLGRHQLAEVLARILQVLESKKEISFGDLLSIFQYDIDRNELMKLMESLKDRGIVKVVRSQEVGGAVYQYIEGSVE
jgi:hypothetical protein